MQISEGGGADRHTILDIGMAVVGLSMDELGFCKWKRRTFM